MAHWAEVDKDNFVVKVIVTDNDDPNGDEGLQWLIDNKIGAPENRWIKTSYNETIRKNFAGAGFVYDEQRDAFIPPKPFDSWVLNEQTCKWEPPISFPDWTEPHYWDEQSKSWKIGIGTDE